MKGREKWKRYGQFSRSIIRNLAIFMIYSTEERPLVGNCTNIASENRLPIKILLPNGRNRVLRIYVAFDVFRLVTQTLAQTVFAEFPKENLKRAKSSSVFTVDVEDVQAKGRGNAVQ